MSPSGAAPPPNERGGVIVRGLRKSFRAGVQGCHARASVLFDVNLDVRPGEIVGICGAVGSGKTTLLLCIAGLLRPDAGTIAVGCAASGCPTRYVARGMPNEPRLTASQCVARALVGRSAVLLLDGIVADLSTGAAALFGQLASSGMTIVAAERDPARLEAVVERMVTLHDGTLHDAGTQQAGSVHRSPARVAEPNATRSYGR